MNPEVIHKLESFSNSFICGYCGRRMPYYYVNKGNNLMEGYYGDRGRYNFRGAKANFIRHIETHERKN